MPLFIDDTLIFYFELVYFFISFFYALFDINRMIFFALKCRYNRTKIYKSSMIANKRKGISYMPCLLSTVNERIP